MNGHAPVGGEERLPRTVSNETRALSQWSKWLEAFSKQRTTKMFGGRHFSFILSVIPQEVSSGTRVWTVGHLHLNLVLGFELDSRTWRKSAKRELHTFVCIVVDDGAPQQATKAKFDLVACCGCGASSSTRTHTKNHSALRAPPVSNCHIQTMEM